MMKMRVVDAGNYQVPRKINAPRVSISEPRDFVRGSDGQDSIAGNRHRLRTPVRWVCRKYLAVQ